jgi:hypothetical protein
LLEQPADERAGLDLLAHGGVGTAGMLGLQHRPLGANYISERFRQVQRRASLGQDLLAGGVLDEKLTLHTVPKALTVLPERARWGRNAVVTDGANFVCYGCATLFVACSNILISHQPEGDDQMTTTMRPRTKTINMAPAPEESVPEPVTQRKQADAGRFRLQVDRQTKASYATYEAAEKAGLGIKKEHPIVQVAVYDGVESVNKIIELP